MLPGKCSEIKKSKLKGPNYMLPSKYLEINFRDEDSEINLRAKCFEIKDPNQKIRNKKWEVNAPK